MQLQNLQTVFSMQFLIRQTKIRALHLDNNDKEVFRGFFKNGDSAQAIADFKSFVEKCGLMFEPCDYDDKMEKGASKVAIFFQDDLARCDFHLYKEETTKGGNVVWTGKVSFSKKVTKEKYLDMNMNGMNFAGCFKISKSSKREKSEEKNGNFKSRSIG